VVDNGSQKLSTGLAKIVNATRAISKPQPRQKQSVTAFKALFIADPDRATADSATINSMQASSSSNLVQEILSKKLTSADRIAEIFSTHPNIIKRLRALQEIS
jgi:heat shock protein HtpX